MTYTGSPAPGDAVVVEQDSPLVLSFETVLSFTAAGQLAAGTGAGTGELLSKGTNGQVLTSGGSDPSGLEWVTPGAPPAVAVLPLQQPVSGNTQAISLPYATASGGFSPVSPTNGFAYYYPMVLNAPAEIIAMAAGVTATAGGTGAVIRFGVYQDSSGAPGTVLLDTGTAAATTPSQNVTLSGLTLSLTAARYWVCFVVQGNPTPVPQVNGRNAVYSLVTGCADSLADALNQNAYGSIGYSQAGVTGALGTASTLSVLATANVSTGYPMIAVGFA